MKAILIDPVAKTVTEVEYSGVYTDVYRLIEADPFTVVSLGRHAGKREAMYLDDEGLYREPQKFFTLCGNGPFAGKGLIVAVDGEGNDVATGLTADMVRPQVEFQNLKVVGWSETKTEENVDIGYGQKGFKITAPQPVFEDVKDA